ncbi:isocitrate lyase/PEP mutase family protein [Rudaeicoccus suwonensis]|uniref:2-methylisocitrate lyase-like PEP mutase family enzyme n=1 Tax=Rudaeicoccus suwonensis TaxID=657409 RepID=A0A561EBH0_9MICO|nr:isocitrate lyase/phosphoenolpyruvate mutase family protein [Rudaeicoccus suwonensis]TWE12942.1 2-methylisocitrate lyase-like PEP mutase family enzyme [Rudaeicoccus suwonensis]
MLTIARRQFADLHRHGTFVIPNPFDVGSAKVLASAGYPALATTSSGLAASLGKADQQVSLDELCAHVTALTDAVDVPVQVDAEACYPHSPGVEHTVEALADAGAAGVSIEDYDPVAGVVLDLPTATERVGIAAQAAHRHGMLLIARAENHLYAAGDVDDTVTRLAAFRAAGADVLYAPGVVAAADISRIVALGAPVNVLAIAGIPSVRDLADLGVRRVSTGGALAWAAYGALLRGADELRDQGSTGYLAGALPAERRAVVFGG